MFKVTSALKHLVLEHEIFLNALDPKDPGYECLKIVELVTSQPSWGEKLPKSWIHLKLMINRSVEGGDTIIKMETLRSINLKKKDLQLFLKMHHSQREIIYFSVPNLRDHIVISPMLFVDTLRSLVKRFCKSDRLKTIKSMNLNGLLRIEDINTIWKGNKQFVQHREYL